MGKPHGVHGDVLVDIITDFPERLTDGLRFGVGGEDGPTEFHEAFRVRYHKGRWLLSVAGLRDRDAIEPLRGRFLFLPALALDELPEGYHARPTGQAEYGLVLIHPKLNRFPRSKPHSVIHFLPTEGIQDMHHQVPLTLPGASTGQHSIVLTQAA